MPDEAFYFIGQEVGDKINIIVEDRLSKKIFDRILLKLGEEVSNRFVVKFIPGGASVLQQNIAVYSNTNIEKSFFVFDGDQKRVDNLFEINSLSYVNKTVDYLKGKIKDQTGVDIKFYPNGGTQGGNQEQLIQMMISYLRYYKDHVFYLSQSSPEDIIWSEEVIRLKLIPSDFSNNIERIRSLESAKFIIYESAKIFFGNENQVEAFEDMLIKEWIEKEDENYKAIKNILESI